MIEAGIRTARLQLIPATIASLSAELAGREALAAELGLDVPESWPPELYDEPATRYTLDALKRAPADEGWWMYYVAEPREAGKAGLVGVVGYKGPPNAEGVVEIGYGTLPEWRRRGYASEAAMALIGRAFGIPTVTTVVAETLPELAVSISVMEKCGMRFVGEGSEAGVIRYGISREAWLEGNRLTPGATL
jgi:RimJ/RimL family protein N-acetyltransferase